MTNSTTGIAREAATTADRRGRRGWKLLWLLVGGLVLFVLLVPAVGYLMWMNRGRAMLRAEIAAIAERGEPLTTEEMEKWREAKYANQPDLTPQWFDAMKPFSGNGFGESLLKSGAVVYKTRSQIGEDWSGPWERERAAQAFVAAWEPHLEAVARLAHMPGSIRHSSASDYVKSLQSGHNLMTLIRLRRTCSLRQGNHDRAIEDTALLSLVVGRLDDDLHAHEPPYSSAFALENTLGLRKLGQFEILQMAKDFKLTAPQLKLLQEIGGVEIGAEKLADAVIRGRADCWNWSSSAGSTEKSESPSASRSLAPSAVRMSFNSAMDCAATLKLHSDAIEASQLDFPDMLSAIERRASEAIDLAESSYVGHLQYHQLSEQAPMLRQLAQSFCEHEVRSSAICVLLAAKRYQLKHGRFPGDMRALVPEFLPSVPVDPFDGLEMRYRLDENELVVWSVYLDRNDDQGEVKFPDGDMAVRFPIAKE